MFLCSRGKRLKASASALMSLEATRTSVRDRQPRSGLMSLCSYVLMFSLKKKLGIAKVICKPIVLVPKTAQESSLSKLGEMAHV